jgi:Fe-S oxidoreductase
VSHFIWPSPAAGLRQELIEALGMPIYEPGQTDYLLWLGCVWAYNPDIRRSLESMVTILKTAGVSFGVLENETCTGHHARRQGEEMQFQTLAEQNIDAIQNAQVDTIIAPCPHCLHTISRDYPALQDDFQPRIIHHSQLMAELLATGKITMDSDKLNGKTTTYHDPCYLGRYERVYDEPRDLIIKAGLNLVEMQRHGPTSMCCGGSAGFARDQDVERRVDQVRAEQVRDTDAEMLVVACPGCKMMLNTAIEETVALAELVADAMVSENGAEIFPLR